MTTGFSIRDAAAAAKQASPQIGALSHAQKQQVLLTVAAQLAEQQGRNLGGQQERYAKCR